MNITRRLAALLGMLLVGALPAVGQQRLPIIDMHMHPQAKVLRDGKPLPIPCDPQPCVERPTAAVSNDDNLRQTLAAMDRYNVVKGFLSGSSQAVQRWVDASPGRFIASPGFNQPNLSLDALRAEYAGGRLGGMGEIGTQYSGIAPNDPRLEPYFALAEEVDVPVLIHTLGFGAHTSGFRSAVGNPLLLEDVLVRHPKLRLYVENAGYPFLAEMVSLMYQYPQLHADVSTITWIIPREAFHDYLRGLIRAGLGKRIMFGTDQMQWPETVGLAVDAIESAEFLTVEQKRDIFYNNAARFLRLSETEIAKHHGR